METMFTDSDETEDNEGDDDEVFPDGMPTLELMGLVSPIVPEPHVEVSKKAQSCLFGSIGRRYVSARLVNARKRRCYSSHIYM